MTIAADRSFETQERTATPLSASEQAAKGAKERIAAYLAFAVICVLWGTTFLAIRIAIETIPTLLVTGLRFLGAGAILVVVSLLSGARYPRGRRDWISQMVSGVLMVAIGNSCVVWAEKSISSGLAALLAAMIPIWMAVLETLIGAGRMTARKALGLLLGFGGVALLVLPAIGHPEASVRFFLAVGAMQLSAIAWNSGTLNAKRNPSRGDATAVASVQMLSGGVVVMLAALLGGTPRSLQFSGRSIAALFYLMIFGSVIAYSAYLYALKHLSASKLSSYAYVNPLIAVVIGAIALGEPLTVRIIAAMIVILAGVAVIQSEWRPLSQRPAKGEKG